MLVLLAQNIKKDFTVIQENISEFFLLWRGDMIYEQPHDAFSDTCSTIVISLQLGV